MKKIKCAIIGPGNIGMNLLYKLKRSNVLECTLFVGRNLSSKNLKEAQKLGVNVGYNSLQSLIDHADEYEIVFDATTSESHKVSAAILKKLDKFTVDLTPSKVGKLCIPCINGEACLGENNVNMITCGGQSMVPLAHALVKACPETSYLETVSTISSASAGEGTRNNIDDYITTTRQALRTFTGVLDTKAMIVLNPAEPPIIMKNTLYAVVKNCDLEKIKKSIFDMSEVIKQYVPGFKIVLEPTLIASDVVTVTAQVEGTGDFLPTYAGNLDVITCAAVEIAEQYAYKYLK